MFDIFFKRDVPCEYTTIIIDVAVPNEYCGIGAEHRTGIKPENLNSFGAAEWEVVEVYKTNEVVRTTDSQTSEVKVELVKAVLRRTIKSSYFGKGVER